MRLLRLLLFMFFVFYAQGTAGGAGGSEEDKEKKRVGQAVVGLGRVATPASSWRWQKNRGKRAGVAKALKQ